MPRAFAALSIPVAEVERYGDVDRDGLLFEEVEVHVHQHHGPAFRVFRGKHALQRRGIGKAFDLFTLVKGFNGVLYVGQRLVERFASREDAGKIRHGHAVVRTSVLMDDNGITHIFTPEGGIVPPFG